MIFSESSGCFNTQQDITRNTIVQELYTKINENHYMTNRMVMMMAELLACSTVADVRKRLRAFIPNMVAWKSWLCIVDGYLKEGGRNIKPPGTVRRLYGAHELYAAPGRAGVRGEYPVFKRGNPA